MLRRQVRKGRKAPGTRSCRRRNGLYRGLFRSWQARAGTDFLLAAMAEPGAPGGMAVADALRGMTLPQPVGIGPGGTLSLRAEDRTATASAI